MRPTMEVRRAAAAVRHIHMYIYVYVYVCGELQRRVTYVRQDIIDDLNNMHNECTVTGAPSARSPPARASRAAPADASSPFPIHQSMAPVQPGRLSPAAAASVASPQKAQPPTPGPAAPAAPLAAADAFGVQTFSSVAAAAARQSAEYHAVGPDGKRVVCDWL